MNILIAGSAIFTTDNTVVNISAESRMNETSGLHVRLVDGVKHDMRGALAAVSGKWGVATTEDVIADIRLNHFSYVVPLSDNSIVTIRLMTVGGRARVWVNWDGTNRNNIDDLPECRQISGFT